MKIQSGHTSEHIRLVRQSIASLQRAMQCLGQQAEAFEETTIYEKLLADFDVANRALDSFEKKLNQYLK